MPEPHDNCMNHESTGLGRALRALPGARPPDLWPRLARRAQRGGHRWRSLGIPLAMAASLLLALLLWPRATPPAHKTRTAMPATTASPDDRTPLPELRERSQRLEDWVRMLNAQGAPLDGPSLAHASRIEDGIGMVDLQLVASHGNPSIQQVLWQQRVNLLQQLATVHIGQARLAAVAAGTPQLFIN